MKKQVLLILLRFSMVVMMMAAVSIPAAAAETIPYLDAEGHTQSVLATAVTSDMTNWSTGWYYVSGNVELNNVIVSGDVHLILADGCNLKAATSGLNSAILVQEADSLTIYGQSGNSGVLTALCSAGGYAGIGGSKGGNCGTIIINGGRITARGGPSGAGIGGGMDGNGGTITINGGTVTVNDGTYGAGIGGGNGGSGGIITINGGTVTAKSSNYCAGIGGGNGGSGGTITINGGTVTATSGYGGAGIGSNDAGTVIINGGTVTATCIYGGTNIGGGAGIGGSTVTINGGSVMAKPGSNSDQAITGTLKNSRGDNVYLTTVTLSDVAGRTAIENLTTSLTDYSYGINDMYTDVDGNLYLYLPTDTKTTAVATSHYTYYGSATTINNGSASEMFYIVVVSSVSVPTSGFYKAGEELDLIVHFNENVMVDTSGGVPYIPLIVGSETKHALYQSGSETSSLTFLYTVGTADYCSDAIAVGSSITLNGGTITSGHTVSPALKDVGSTENIFVDGVAPSITISSSISGATNESPIPITFTFSESVTGFDASALTVSNGAVWDFTGSGTTYTADVIPFSDGLVTVDIAENIAQDQAGNRNTAAAQFSCTYDSSAPSLSGVTPSADAVSVEISGNVIIRFSEAMGTSVGTIALKPFDGDDRILSGGTWSCDDTIYTVPYSGLAYGTDYTLDILGFQDPAGNVMPAYSHGFTTELEPLVPSVSPENLTVGKGGTASFSVALGQGTAAATLADISVDDIDIIQLNPVSLLENNSVTVAALEIGTAVITVTFNDTADTEKTISVAVEAGPPVWPTDSSLAFSGVTQTTAALIWPEAAGLVPVTGYQIYQNGVLVDTVDSLTLSYNITGLTSNTTYSFQVQAGNGDGIWSSNGPTASVTTRAPSSGRSSSSSVEDVKKENPSTDNPFTDVALTDWSYDGVMYVYKNGLMRGSDTGSFNLNGVMTRAMAVVVLNRLSGDTVGYINEFSDVGSGAWYESAVAWASANGITSGTGANRFNPAGGITRQQLSVMLYNYAKLKGIDVSLENNTYILSFKDSQCISDYAFSALQWACGAGILQGDTDGKLLPQGVTTRAEFVTMLQRFLESAAVN